MRLFRRGAKLDQIDRPTWVRLEGSLACAAPAESPISAARAALIECCLFEHEPSYAIPELKRSPALLHYEPSVRMLCRMVRMGDVSLESEHGSISLCAPGLAVRFASTPQDERPIDRDLIPAAMRADLPRDRDLGELCYTERLIHEGVRLRLEAVIERRASPRHPYRGAFGALFALRPDLGPARLLCL